MNRRGNKKKVPDRRKYANKYANHDSDCDDCDDRCEPCVECDSCLVDTLNAYARTVAKINQIYADTVLALGALDPPLGPLELSARVLLLGVQRFNFIGRLQQAIDAFTECDNQECCEIFANAIQLITASYYRALAAEVQALLPLPLTEDYLLLLQNSYDFLFDQIGCPPPVVVPPLDSEAVVQKLAISEKEKSFWTMAINQATAQATIEENVPIKTEEVVS